MSTDYAKQIEILNEIFMNHTDEEPYVEFADFNDIGLPLAHLLNNGIVSTTPQAEEYVRETFGLLLALFGIDEDTGFKSLEQISKQK